MAYHMLFAFKAKINVTTKALNLCHGTLDLNSRWGREGTWESLTNRIRCKQVTLLLDNLLYDGAIKLLKAVLGRAE
jgi:hypothetical protein